jgi:hypothetical protein
MCSLPRDERGYPVPYFVEWIAGPEGDVKPDFRVVSGATVVDCWNHKKCWICGGALGVFKAFTIGPMCALNRVSSEPPQHRECATFAARNCPFLVRPRAQRRDAGLTDLIGPDPKAYVSGQMIERNPGVALVWVTRKPAPVKVDNGVLFNVGEPVSVGFYCAGRPATRAEVMAAIDSGVPILQDMCEKETTAAGKAEAAAELRRMYGVAKQLVYDNIPDGGGTGHGNGDARLGEGGAA